MTKRDIFAELMEGFDALKGERQGKVTLRTSKAECNTPPEINPEKTRALLRKMHVSQPVFSRILRTKKQINKN